MMTTSPPLRHTIHRKISTRWLRSQTSRLSRLQLVRIQPRWVHGAVNSCQPRRERRPPGHAAFPLYPTPPLTSTRTMVVRNMYDCVASAQQ